MTEAQWLTCDDPRKLVEWLRRKVGDRKFRLFACAFWRWEGGAEAEPDTELAQALRYVEVWADSGTRPELPIPLGFGWHPLVTNEAHASANWTIRNKRGFSKADPAQAAAVGVSLLRDIFGNPFRTVKDDLGWRTSTVLTLAREVYESLTSPSCRSWPTPSRTPGATVMTSSHTAGQRGRTSAGAGWSTSSWGGGSRHAAVG